MFWRTVSEFVLKAKTIGDALKSTSEMIRDHDLLLNMLNGLGHEYDLIVVLISSHKQTMSIQEAQYLLKIHEQRIARLNTVSQVDIKSVSSCLVECSTALKKSINVYLSFLELFGCDFKIVYFKLSRD